ncbi:MAG: hypothetical protein A3C90_01145 [Candidatus Magasanikbacteria bacterium RIFCSPHIGHO2_02_FULL_51_14]|uniref:Uncharacterized protein n=1 Tax=Candidatus Magasanikbacteria bacterium RIFCSPHIGHO2_02_FULL_51_14 TaxID=1798683 RepID=A0A1F6MQ27_9BACT|nr:MAG: hypothetical protein A3C90_01145 [Candidatus Magasanikbacteria bacterium RIFCSPHIGHO2_02_FULL_51_14]
MAKKEKPAKPVKIEDALLVGLGAAGVARERATDFFEYLIKEGKLAVKDKQKLRKKLTTKGEKELHMMTKVYESAVKSVLHTLNIPTRSEFEALKRRVGPKRKSKKSR